MQGISTIIQLKNAMNVAENSFMKKIDYIMPEKNMKRK